MSLLNQVLQDLDERAPAAQPRSVHLTVAPAAERHGDDPDDRRSDWVRLGTGFLVVSAFVGAVWLFYPANDSGSVGASAEVPSSSSMPAAVVAVAAAEENVPVVDDMIVDAAAVKPANPPRAVMPLQPENAPKAMVPAAVTQASGSPGSPSNDSPVAGNEAMVTAEELDDVTYLVLRNTELPAVAADVDPAADPLTAGRSVKTAKPNPTESIDRARLAIEVGELSSAEAQLQQHLSQEPGDRDARELLVGLMLRGGRFGPALQQLDEGLVHHPRHGKFVLIKARLLAQQGESEAAIRVLESSVRTDSGRVERLQMLGALYQQRSRFAEAVDSYRALLKIDDAVGSSWVGLAISLDGQGDPKALQAYRHALKLGGVPVAAESYARQRIAQLELHGD